MQQRVPCGFYFVITGSNYSARKWGTAAFNQAEDSDWDSILDHFYLALNYQLKNDLVHQPTPKTLNDLSDAATQEMLIHDREDERSTDQPHPRLMGLAQHQGSRGWRPSSRCQLSLCSWSAHVSPLRKGSTAEKISFLYFGQQKKKLSRSEWGSAQTFLHPELFNVFCFIKCILSSVSNLFLSWESDGFRLTIPRLTGPPAE